MASIGQFTGTEVFSGPTHILQCRVSEDVLRLFAKEGDKDRVHQKENKMLYCMHKKEIALCCSIPYNPLKNFLYRTTKQAYPPVVTTLGDISDKMKQLIRTVYNCQTRGQYETVRAAIIRYSSEHPQFDFSMPDFTFMGVAQTQAWATTNFGDNVGSVLVAGFQTFTNGHYPCYAGDLVHWYFDFESGMFREDGKRRFEDHMEPLGRDADANRRVQNIDQNGFTYENNSTIGDKATTRKNWHEMREYGNYPDLYKNNIVDGSSNKYKKNVVYPKPYHYMESGYGDFKRIFGRVVNGGKPFEKIDILILSQCR